MTAHTPIVREVIDLADPATLVLDINNPRGKDVIAIVEALELDIKKHPIQGVLPVVTGWNDIGPAKALDLLRRNRPGANRKVDAATVFYYARQMRDGEWKETGQPMLIDSDGRLIDAQHRLLAIVISGVTIRSFVVTEIKAIPDLFAYIDNSRPRSTAVALQTAGFNGVSTIIAKVIKIAEEVAIGVYDHGGAVKLPRLTPAEVLHLASKYPNAREASRAAKSDWDGITAYVGTSKIDIIAYFGMRVTDLYDYDMADNFFEDFSVVATDKEERDEASPFTALCKMIDKELRDGTLKREHLLGAMIKTFNAWRKSAVLGRRWMQSVNEDLPKFDDPPETEEAA